MLSGNVRDLQDIRRMLSAFTKNYDHYFVGHCRSNKAL